MIDVSSKEIESCKNRIRQQQNTILLLKNDLNDRDLEIVQFRAHQMKCLSEINSLKQKIIDMNNSRHQSFETPRQARDTQAELEIERLRGIIRDLKKPIPRPNYDETLENNYRREIETLQDEKAALATRLQNTVHQKNKEIQNLLGKLDEFIEEKANADSLLHSSEKQLLELREKESQLHHKVSSLNKHKSEVFHLRSKCVQLEGLSNTLKSDITNLEAEIVLRKAECSQHQAHLSQRDENIQQLSGQLHRMKSHVLNYESHSEERTHELESEIDTLRRQKNDLEKLYGTLQADFQQTQNTLAENYRMLSEERKMNIALKNELQQHGDALKTKSEHLNMMIERGHGEESLAKLRELCKERQIKIDLLKTEKVNLTEELKLNRLKLEKSNQQKVTIARLEQEKSELSSNIRTLEDLKKVNIESSERQETDISTLKKELRRKDIIIERIKSLVPLYSDSSNKVDELQNILQKYEEKKEEKEEQIQILQNKLKEKEDIIAHFHSSLPEATLHDVLVEENASLRQKNQLFAAEIENLKNLTPSGPDLTPQQLHIQLQEYKRHIEEKENEITILQMELESQPTPTDSIPLDDALVNSIGNDALLCCHHFETIKKMKTLLCNGVTDGDQKKIELLGLGDDSLDKPKESTENVQIIQVFETIKGLKQDMASFRKSVVDDFTESIASECAIQ